MASRPPRVSLPAVATAPQSVRFSYSSPESPPLRRLLIQTLERAGGQRKLKRLYDRKVVTHWTDETDFFGLAVQALRLDIVYDPALLDRVPRDGPVLFVANHPYGVLDGIVLTWLAAKVRPDVKVLANALLCQVPGADKHLLPVDFDATPQAVRTTLNSRVEAQKWLRQGGAIGIFPGGGVSTSTRPLKGPACDPPWHPFTAKLAMGAKATVVPVYFAGQNSRLFQIASHLSYTLRLSLLFRETVRRIGTRLDVGIGDAIPYEALGPFADRADLVRDLRRRTFALADPHRRSGRPLDAYSAEFHYPRRVYR